MDPPIAPAHTPVVLGAGWSPRSGHGSGLYWHPAVAGINMGRRGWAQACMYVCKHSHSMVLAIAQSVPSRKYPRLIVYVALGHPIESSTYDNRLQ